MHPEISQLPSEVFYQKKLLDGPAMDEKTKQGWHRSPMFPPYCFFNVGGQEQSAFTGSSLVNRTEAQVAAALYARLQKDFPLVDFSFRVGVVSMYRAQIVELKKVFRERFGMDILEKVDFNTVDGFQGQEKDIIILSCVRASTGGTSVGFLAGELYRCISTNVTFSHAFRRTTNERRTHSCSFLAVYSRPCINLTAQRRQLENHRRKRQVQVSPSRGRPTPLPPCNRRSSHLLFRVPLRTFHVLDNLLPQLSPTSLRCQP
jgi:hypothetical protein